jgi:truncated hemoglobin YjbI/ankyrin repeat protein
MVDEKSVDASENDTSVDETSSAKLHRQGTANVDGAGGEVVAAENGTDASVSSRTSSKNSGMSQSSGMSEQSSQVTGTELTQSSDMDNVDVSDTFGASGSNSDEKTDQDNAQLSKARGTVDALNEAVIRNDLLAVRREITKNENIVSETNDRGWSALRKSARSGSTALVSLLLEKRAAAGSHDQAALITAAAWGQHNVIQLLLEAKASIRGREYVEDTDSKRQETEEEERERKHRATQFRWEQSPLALAAKGGHLETCRLLIDRKFDVNYVDEMGNDPLMVAFNQGHQQLIFFLVERGANVKTISDWDILKTVPQLVLQIAEGCASRQKILLDAVKNSTNRGLIQKYYKPGLEMEIETVCIYMQQVPRTAIVLLDEVLTMPSRDAPAAAILREDMHTAYVDADEFIQEQKKDLADLVPDYNLSAATPVGVRCCHQRGMLDFRMLYVIIDSDPDIIFNCRTVKAVVHYCWKTYAYPRYMWDLGFQIFAIGLGWEGTLNTGEGTAAIHLMLNVIVAIIFTVYAGLEIFRRSAHGAPMLGGTKGGKGKDELISLEQQGITFMRVADMVVCAMFFVYWFGAEGHIEGHVGNHYIVFAIYLLFRWFMLVQHLQFYSTSWGPPLVALLRTMEATIPFLITIWAFLMATTNSIHMLNNDGILWHTFEKVYALGIMSDLKVEDIKIYTEAELLEVVWFFYILGGLFMSAIMHAFLINILISAYDMGRFHANTVFAKARADLVFRYCLAMEHPEISPVEWLLQKLFPSLFLTMPKTQANDHEEKTGEKPHSLWYSYKDFDPYDLEYNQREGRKRGILGWLTYNANDAVEKSVDTMEKSVDQIGEKVEKLLQRNTESFFEMQGMAYEVFNMKHQVHSLFHRIGGAKQIEMLHQDFYNKVVNCTSEGMGLLNGSVYVFLRGVIDEKELEMHTKAFVTQACGGEKDFTREIVRQVNKAALAAGVDYPTSEQFDAVANHMTRVLIEMRMDEREISEVAKVMVDEIKPEVCGWSRTLFAQLGGEEKISRGFDKFYSGVLKDSRISGIFKTCTRLSNLKKQQRLFITKEFGGESDELRLGQHSMAELEDIMRSCNGGHHLKAAQFDVLVEHMVKVLHKELEVKEHVIEEVVQKVMTYKDVFLGTHTKTLYDRLGKSKAVEALVDGLFDRIAKDSRVADLYSQEDMHALKHQQRHFFTFAFGGGGKKPKRDVASPNDRVNQPGGYPTSEQFEMIAGHLVACLHELHCAEADMEAIVELAIAHKDDVIGLKTANLFARMGGATGVAAVVDKFVGNLNADDRLKTLIDPKYNKKLDLEKLKRHQCTYLTTAFGGPHPDKSQEKIGDLSSDISLGNGMVHYGVSPDENQWDLITGYLQECLMETKEMKQDEVDRLVEVAMFVEAGGPLFDRIGGQKGVKIVAEKLFKKVVKDRRLMELFGTEEEVKTNKKIADNVSKQVLEFLTQSFGGEEKYTVDAEMCKKRATEGLFRSSDTFDIFAGHLVTTLAEGQMADTLIEEVIVIAMAIKDAVLINVEGYDIISERGKSPRTYMSPREEPIQVEVQVGGRTGSKTSMVSQEMQELGSYVEQNKENRTTSKESAQAMSWTVLKPSFQEIFAKYNERVMEDDNCGMLIKNAIRDSDPAQAKEMRQKFVKTYLIMSLGGNPDDHAGGSDKAMDCMSNAQLVELYRQMNGKVPSASQREENYEHMVANLLATLQKDMNNLPPALVKETIDRALAAKDQICSLLPMTP